MVSENQDGECFSAACLHLPEVCCPSYGHMAATCHQLTPRLQGKPQIGLNRGVCPPDLEQSVGGAMCVANGGKALSLRAQLACGQWFPGEKPGQMDLSLESGKCEHRIQTVWLW